MIVHVRWKYLNLNFNFEAKQGYKKKRKNVASFSNKVFSIRKYTKVGITNDWHTKMCASTNQVKGG